MYKNKNGGDHQGLVTILNLITLILLLSSMIIGLIMTDKEYRDNSIKYQVSNK